MRKEILIKTSVGTYIIEKPQETVYLKEFPQLGTIKDKNENFWYVSGIFFLDGHNLIECVEGEYKFVFNSYCPFIYSFFKRKWRNFEIES